MTLTYDETADFMLEGYITSCPYFKYGEYTYFEITSNTVCNYQGKMDLISSCKNCQLERKVEG
jgi:hypothetical protein